ncbi:hypothetical protein HPB49_012534 [Dermacentor silvarum]|uniref:Uncharacterized protein n=1 Tax=Dermacentor silvarum TaxID=543639 RepID=A0ACB8C3M8_DERSI|nr:uncharacterized protein LOC119464920 [Dermacentor silvarum]KAH7933438.1 hypothetical protein HPB49_012534 [Dermacentor silvarum]
MLALTLAAGISFASTLRIGQGEIQRPELTQCPFTKKALELQNLVIQDLALGRDMKLNFTGLLLEETVGEPALKFTMWNSYNVRMPCIEDYGSCTYKMCGGTTVIEKMASGSWNNTCPILPGTYETYMKLPVISAAKYVRENGTFRVKLEAVNGREVVECKTFHVYLAPN